MAIRFRSRHLHATFYHYTAAQLAARGWSGSTVNFGTQAVTVVDYQPDERGQLIKANTVAVSLADYVADEDEELGAAIGGVRSAPYRIYLDVYMAEQALAYAICDDLRDIFEDLTLQLVDQITGLEVADAPIEVENVLGPERPSQVLGAEQFKKFWRTMRLDTRLFFQT
jgi:hypothetical protein